MKKLALITLAIALAPAAQATESGRWRMDFAHFAECMKTGKGMPRINSGLHPFDPSTVVVKNLGSGRHSLLVEGKHGSPQGGWLYLFMYYPTDAAAVQVQVDLGIRLSRWDRPWRQRNVVYVADHHWNAATISAASDCEERVWVR